MNKVIKLSLILMIVIFIGSLLSCQVSCKDGKTCPKCAKCTANPKCPDCTKDKMCANCAAKAKNMKNAKCPNCKDGKTCKSCLKKQKALKYQIKPMPYMKKFSFDGEPPIYQLTFFGKENSEAYFSPDSKYIIFQGQDENDEFLQVYIMNLETGEYKRITNTKGKEVCTYFHPSGNKILFSSTMSQHTDQVRDYGAHGWKYPMTFEIYTANADGTNIKRLTTNNAYEAETSFSPDGQRILFTSDRDGNLELYSMDLDGKDVQRITNTPDLNEGGPFYSNDGKKIVTRAWEKVKKGESIKDAQIYVLNADGTDCHKVTDDNFLNWSPYFTPDGKKILFASNRAGKRDFEIYIMNTDGSNIKRLTYNAGKIPFVDGFDSYPVVSPDGNYILFSSGRSGKYQIFLMDISQVND